MSSLFQNTRYQNFREWRQVWVSNVLIFCLFGLGLSFYFVALRYDVDPFSEHAVIGIFFFFISLILLLASFTISGLSLFSLLVDILFNRIYSIKFIELLGLTPCYYVFYKLMKIVVITLMHA